MKWLTVSLCGFIFTGVVGACGQNTNHGITVEEKKGGSVKSLEEHVIMLHLASIADHSPGANTRDAELTMEQRNWVCGEMFQIWLIFYGPQPVGDHKKQYVDKLLAGARRWYCVSAKSSELYSDPLGVSKAMRQEGRSLAEQHGRLVGVDSTQVKTWEDYQKLVSGFHTWIDEK